MPNIPREANLSHSTTAQVPRNEVRTSGVLPLAGSLCAAVLFAVYLITLCPTVHWLDGGELTAAAVHLTAAHPPGEASYILLAKLVSLFPIGPLPFRLGLLSALSAALCAPLGLSIFNHMLPKHASAPAGAGTIAILSVMGGLLTYPLWIQAVRVEVYAPELLLTLLTIDLLLRAGLLEARLDIHLGVAAALVFGLNLGIHPLIAGLSTLPAILIGLFCRDGRRIRLWSLSAGAVFLGYSVNLLIPLRASIHPSFGWGSATTAPNLIDMLLARAFSRNFSEPTEGLIGHNLEVILDTLFTTPGPLLLGLSLLGLLGLIWRRLWRSLALLSGIILLTLWALLPQNKVFGTNPDFHGYLMVVHLLLWLLAGWAVLMITAWARKKFQMAGWLGSFLLLLVGLAPVILSWDRADRSQDTLAQTHGMKALEGLPSGAYLQVSGNNTTFILQYLQEVEFRRPDVTVLPRILLTHPWMRTRYAFPEPWLRAAAGPATDFYPLVRPRALRVELRTIDLSGARQLCPAPAAGWGFYDLGPCPDLETNTPPAVAGLTLDRRAYSGPEALSVGLNARAFLADYYQARGLMTWAQKERAALQRLQRQ